MALTDTAIKQAKGRDKPYKLYDERGLFLLITPKGGKCWRFKYRWAPTGKEKSLALGVYPDISLADARRKLDDARKLLANETDPAQVKKDKKIEQKNQAANTFENNARAWFAARKETWDKKHAARIIHSLEVDVFPHIGGYPINQIKTSDLLDVVKRIEKRDALDVASRISQRIAAVFRYAVQNDRATYNPANDLKGAIKTRKVTHRAMIDRKDLPEFLAKLENYDGDPITRLGLKLIILTMVRTGELRGARWDEFDLEAAQWRIPAARMKMDVEHIVPLSKQALAVLEELKPHTGRFALVFPNTNQVTRPMSENTMLFALYRMGYHGRATTHGFRATASTILNESGHKPDVIERQLAHAERNKIRASYNRAEYLPERKIMLQWWADFLDGVTDNVIPIMRGMA